MPAFVHQVADIVQDRLCGVGCRGRSKPVDRSQAYDDGDLPGMESVFPSFRFDGARMVVKGENCRLRLLWPQQMERKVMEKKI